MKVWRDLRFRYIGSNHLLALIGQTFWWGPGDPLPERGPRISQ